MSKEPSNLKDALKRIAELETQIEQFRTHTKKKFYRGIQRQLDIISDELLEPDFKISLEPEFQTGANGNPIKIATAFDNFFDMLVKGEAILKSMKNFEGEIFVSDKTDEKPKPLSEDSAENYLKK